MIDFIDFVPEFTEEGLFCKSTFEGIRAALTNANKWIEKNNIDVINVETVVLPNIHRKHEDGSEDGSLRTLGKSGSDWHQFIRVWYNAGPAVKK